MTTKAELEAELQQLRARNAELTDQARDKAAPQSESTTHKTTEEIRQLLQDHGIDLSKAEAMGEMVVEEFNRLQKDYPIAALLVAFSLGYVVGRAQG